ncbi:TetR family transcriptional regulator [Actinoplanes sp. NPDC051494]|uniref:TetR/AcrR family transcriptional regulator n=1 Tax=Actinoplanes sp. NPDC051494 TaxID=3363907 RepID=UPI00378C52D5
MTTSPARRPRRRDPEGHRQAILEAAQACFGELGYTRTTVRGIAARAGVTHGLVLHQFTSKEQLFLAAVPGHRDLGEVLAGDRAGLPERVARGFVERMETGAAGDPLVAVLRGAASNEKAAAALFDAMETNSVAAYSGMLDGDDAPARVALLGAQLVGVTFTRYIAATGPLARMSPDELTGHLTRVLRQILFDR